MCHFMIRHAASAMTGNPRGDRQTDAEPAGDRRAPGGGELDPELHHERRRFLDRLRSFGLGEQQDTLLTSTDLATPEPDA